ncbi:hypothetical protein TNCV_3998821 [Trichonephila clavipes]|nr:hypothetical protein TNCV_3998821 [Trichonephila clavipes]
MVMPVSGGVPDRDCMTLSLLLTKSISGLFCFSKVVRLNPDVILDLSCNRALYIKFVGVSRWLGAEVRKKQDEVRLLESAIRMRNEEQRRKGIELDATCQICMKTKFADGIGHVCNYCNVRCCARCGGKVSLRSNKNSYGQNFLKLYLRAIKGVLKTYHSRTMESSSGILLFSDSRSALQVILKGKSQQTQDIILLLNSVVAAQRTHFAMDSDPCRHLRQ